MSNKIVDVTILSKDEFLDNFKRLDLNACYSSWLRTSEKEGCADFVHWKGYIAENLVSCIGGIVPVLVLENEEDLKTNIYYNGKLFKMISPNKAVCTDVVYAMPFGETNNFETSNIKKYLDNWVKVNGNVI